MFKNIEISEVNKGFVLNTLWNEFAALCLLTYGVILIFFIPAVAEQGNVSLLNTVFVSLIALVYFMYITFFHWASLLLISWLLERFLITKPAGEKRVYLLLAIELSIGSIMVIFSQNHTVLGDYLPWMMAILFGSKLIRLFMLKRKNNLLNKWTKN